MKAQSVASGGDGNMGAMNQAILEINPKHPIVLDLERMVRSDKDSADTKNFAMLMYDVASMTSGYEVSDAGEFAQRVMAMMVSKAKEDVGSEESNAKENSNDDDDDEAITPEIVG
jgi:HSP90 family molecular chaperone